MDKKKILQSDILDIIFYDRNKSYGAYELRRNYEKRARKAVAGMMIFALVAVSAPLIAGLIGPKVKMPPPPPYDTIVFKPIDLPHHPSVPPQPPKVNHPKTPQPQIPIDIARADDFHDTPKPDDPKPAGPTGPTDPTGPSDPTAPFDPNGGLATSGPSKPPVIDITPDPNDVFEIGDIQQMPEYPGGEDALMAYLSSQIKYPRRALDADVQGRVMLGFVINKDGDIDEVKVLRGIGYGCDEEAMRVVKGMPKWKSGKNNGKPVRVYFNLPITFELGG